MAPQILSKRHARVLARFAASDVLVALDYDGTLAPIVSTPRKARMRTRTRQLLAAVAQRYPCVVISGRARDDVTARVSSIPVWHVAGNHGLEPWGEEALYATRVRSWVRTLRRGLAGVEGVTIEDKTYSVTLHFRQAKRKDLARRAVTDVLRLLRGARIIGGSEALNVVPRGAPHKGQALERARRLLACDTAIYVGDDETDEDAFAAGRSDRLLSVRIGNARRSCATYRLRDQREIDRFLRRLLALRPVSYSIAGLRPHATFAAPRGPGRRAVARPVAVDQRRVLFLDQIRRVAPVERGRAEWILGTERLRRPGRVERNRFSPSFREEQGTESVADFMLSANLEEVQRDAFDLGEGRRLNDSDTHHGQHLPSPGLRAVLMPASILAAGKS